MTNLVRFSSTSDVRRMQREIDQLFESFFPARSGDSNGDSAVWSPRVDLAETDDVYLIYLDVPGMQKDDISLNFHDGQLSVSGERTFSEREEEPTFVRVERLAGSFYRSFTLPKRVDADGIEATYADGVLTIRVPKAEESKPRRISVQ